MGLLHIALAHDRGFTVYGSDFNEDRRHVAATLGAAAVFDPAVALADLHKQTGARGADVVICGPGQASALQHAIDACAPGGTVLMFTPLEPGCDFAFDQSHAYFRDLSFVSSYSCGPADTAEALTLLQRGVVNSARISAAFFELEETARGYRDMADARVIKSIIRLPSFNG